MAHPVGLDRVIEPRDGVLSLDEGWRKTAARNTEHQQHRLLHSPRLAAVGLSVVYETWPQMGWCYWLCY